MGMFPKISNKKKDGIALAFPDVCMTPAPPAPPVPIPIPNVHISKLKTVTKKVKVVQKKVLTKGSKTTRSSGDEAGTKMGVASNKSMDKIYVLMSQHERVMRSAPKLDHKRATRLQVTFERNLERECNALLRATKPDRAAYDAIRKLVTEIGKAVRGH